jgi:uncharacterized membrane protein
MVPFFLLIGAWLVFRAIGLAGVMPLDGWQLPLRGALALMFAFTASAHFGRRRADLVAMVPLRLPLAGALVTTTGILELVGAAGLLVPATTPLVMAGLAALLIAMFPANVLTATARLSIGGRDAPPLALRTAIQVVFLVALGLAAV